MNDYRITMVSTDPDSAAVFAIYRKGMTLHDTVEQAEAQYGPHFEAGAVAVAESVG